MKSALLWRQLRRPESDLRSFGRDCRTVTGFSVAMLSACHILAGDGRAEEAAGPGLVFREDWKTTPVATPITQDHVATDGLILALHGPGKQRIRKSHHDRPADDPYYLWSGLCQGRWAFSLRPERYSINLSAPDAKLRLRTKQSGGHQLYAIVRVQGEGWYVSTQSLPTTADWKEFELKIADLNWSRFDIDKIVREKDERPASLEVVEEIGLTDLRPGNRTRASSRVDWIEVWGNVSNRDQ
jgi:hypothetical protein